MRLFSATDVFLNQYSPTIELKQIKIYSLEFLESLSSDLGLGKTVPYYLALGSAHHKDGRIWTKFRKLLPPAKLWCLLMVS